MGFIVLINLLYPDSYWVVVFRMQYFVWLYENSIHDLHSNVFSFWYVLLRQIFCVIYVVIIVAAAYLGQDTRKRNFNLNDVFLVKLKLYDTTMMPPSGYSMKHQTSSRSAKWSSIAQMILQVKWKRLALLLTITFIID